MPIEARKTHTIPLTVHKDEDGLDIYQPEGSTANNRYLSTMCVEEIPYIFSYDNRWGINTTLPYDLNDYLGEHMQPVIALVDEIKERISTNIFGITQPGYAYPSSTPTEFVMGRINTEELTLDVYHFEITKPDDSYVYGFEVGHRTDSISGEYGQPYWGDIIEHNGLPIIVKTEEEAIKVMDECNKQYDKEFNSVGERSAHVGYLPFDIKFIKIPSSGIRTTTAEEAISFLTSIDTSNQ